MSTSSSKAVSHRFRRETELYPPILSYFKRCPVRAEEVPFVGKSVDLVFIATNGVVTTVEAKIANWRKALKQATVNRLGCDYAYVAVPRNHASTIEHEQFVQRGVGLFIVDGTAEKAIPATRATYKDVELARLLRLSAVERS